MVDLISLLSMGHFPDFLHDSSLKFLKQDIVSKVFINCRNILIEIGYIKMFFFTKYWLPTWAKTHKRTKYSKFHVLIAMGFSHLMMILLFRINGSMETTSVFLQPQ